MKKLRLKQVRTISHILAAVAIVIVLIGWASTTLVLIGSAIAIAAIVFLAAFHRCPHCGSYLRFKSKYCPDCGKEIAEE